MKGERVGETGGERGEGGIIRVDERRKSRGDRKRERRGGIRRVDGRRTSGGERWRERRGRSNKGG